MRQIINRVIAWNQERGLLDASFNKETESLNLLEEVIEFNYDVPSDMARAFAQELDTVMQVRAKELALCESSENQKIDALSDLRVLAIGATAKLMYDPYYVMTQTLEEIESRTGSIVDGKFVKDTSPEAQNRWYTAKYKSCKVSKFDRINANSKVGIS